MPMPLVTIAFAGVLVLMGLVAWGLAGFTPETKTALIPSGVGVLFLLLGIVALHAGLRKHIMHASMALALLLVIAMAFMAGPKVPALLTGGEVTRPTAVATQALLGVFALIYLAIGIKSFVDARRKPAGAVEG